MFPILLYNGDAKWTAPFCFEERIEKSISKGFIPHYMQLIKDSATYGPAFVYPYTAGPCAVLLLVGSNQEKSEITGLSIKESEKLKE